MGSGARVFVRLLVLLLGAMLLTLAVGQVDRPYRETVAYAGAGPCPPSASTAAAPPQRPCLDSLTAEVLDKERTYRSGPHGGDTTHRVKLLLPSGDTVWRKVGKPVYEVAERGGHAELTVWRGRTVGVAVDGEYSGSSPNAARELAMWALLGWSGAGLVLWSALGDGRPRLKLFVQTVCWLAIGAVGCLLLALSAQDGFRIGLTLALTVIVVLPALYTLIVVRET
ncbi:hypothetical protein GL263_20730 [Streptomyces durbertensis]|uniref:Integral membrane protein n=1 Tax=Streptomyces durbertensis TaxID=2448886 RepID=A0ABR6ELG7_9ACTN|nr:hypothetical protein [Streptomyces durbertensis]MBB1245957.1 hypothetical protein [Streptomyces durbertensis]